MKVRVLYVRTFCSVHLRMYTTLWKGTCGYLIFYHSESLNCDLLFEWVSIKDNTYVIEPKMPIISPFVLDGNPKSLKVFSPPLTSREKGYAPPEYMLKSLLSKLPLTYRQDLQEDVLQKKYDFIHHNWPSYHQRLIHTTPNQVGIHDIIRTLHYPSQV